MRSNTGSDIDWVAEQAAFERWYLATQCMQNYRRVSKHVETGLYVDKLVRIAWRAWRQGVERAAASKVSAAQSKSLTRESVGG